MCRYDGLQAYLLHLSGILQAVAEAGGAALWAAGGAGFEDAVRQCCGGLADPVRGVGDAWGSALGALAASGKSAAASQAVRAPTAVLLLVQSSFVMAVSNAGNGNGVGPRENVWAAFRAPRPPPAGTQLPKRLVMPHWQGRQDVSKEWLGCAKCVAASCRPCDPDGKVRGAAVGALAAFVEVPASFFGMNMQFIASCLSPCSRYLQA